MLRGFTLLWTIVTLFALGVLAWSAPITGHWIGFAQFLAMPRMVFAILGLIGAILVLTAFLRRRARLFAIACCTIVAIAVTALLPSTPALNRRGEVFATSAVPARDSAAIRLLSWNVGGQASSLDDVTALALAVRPQVIALPETPVSQASDLARRLTDQGLPMSTVSRTTDDAAWPTSVLVSPSLGRYRLVNDTSQIVRGGIVVQPDTPGQPTLVVAHTQQPGINGDQAATWRSHLSWLADWCDRGDTIVVGDFNATEANIGSQLGSCAGVADAAGNAEAGTWPSALPEWLGSPIDRAYTSNDWHAIGQWTIGDARVSASDHRPIVVDVSESSR